MEPVKRWGEWKVFQGRRGALRSRFIAAGKSKEDSMCGAESEVRLRRAIEGQESTEFK